jgi:hypothetical protein
MKIVALSGWKGSGKDMVADYLFSHHGFEKLSFASVLKDMTAIQYNIPRSHFDDRDFKEAPILTLPVTSEDNWSDAILEMVYPHLRTKDSQAPEYFLIYKGMAYGTMPLSGHSKDGIPLNLTAPLYHTPRSLLIIEGCTKRSIALDYWVKAALASTKPDGLYVISDVRFKSEMRQLRDTIGPANVLSIRIERFEETSSVDPSERDLDSWLFDGYLNNKQSEGITKSEVFEQVDTFIELLWV